MLSNELSTIQFKNLQRAELAEAMARFQGTITVIEAPLVRAEQPGDWRRSLTLPGSANVSALDRQEAIMLDTIRSMAAQGIGISGMQKQLKADPRRIRMLARRGRITIPDARATQPRTLSAQARSGRVDAAAARRAKLATKLEPMAAQGLTIQAMSDATGASKRHIMQTLDEYKIERRRKGRQEEPWH